MIIIALYNLKGGVGKTTGCVNLSYAAAADGYKTLLWDLDAQGAASYFLGYAQEEKRTIQKVLQQDAILTTVIQKDMFDNLDLIPADLSAGKMDILLNDADKSPAKQLKHWLKPLKDIYDFVFLDCPPGFSTLADAIFKVSDVVLMPAIPTTLSVRTYEIVKAHMEDKKIDADKLMCYFNMVDIRKNLHMEVMQTYAKDMRFFQYFIPSSSDIEKMGLHQKPILATSPNSRGSHSFQALWEEIKEGVIA